MGPEVAAGPSFVTVDGVRLEVAWYGTDDDRAPIVLLHEGLGCVGLWKDFPARLAEATGRRVLAYSRRGYGRSDTIAAPREPDFMHREALDVLPPLLAALGVSRPVLVGHSDGGSIALIHAGAGYPLSGVAVMAPHVFVEPFSLAEIRKARTAWATTDLRARLARWHDDPDAAFRGWNDIWLDPRFEAWNIEDCLPGITGPLLALQGRDDEYGTLEQIHRIARTCPQTRLVEVDDCRHSPHRDQPGVVLAALAEFCAWL
jgi:pimeloyl-ACP methyl ester carboxylesterase